MHGSLYVSQRTPSGFFVRENELGHSTVAFDYRIVGRPYGVAIQHLPSAPLTRQGPKIPLQMPTFPTHAKIRVGATSIRRP
jgi:hypothetical protein